MTIRKNAFARLSKLFAAPDPTGYKPVRPELFDIKISNIAKITQRELVPRDANSILLPLRHLEWSLRAPDDNPSEIN